MTATRPVSVVIPTIGRPALLRECLASIAACDPRPVTPTGWRPSPKAARPGNCGWSVALAVGSRGL
jgi:hypothetical protein